MHVSTVITTFTSDHKHTIVPLSLQSPYKHSHPTAVCHFCATTCPSLSITTLKAFPTAGGLQKRVVGWWDCLVRLVGLGQTDFQWCNCYSVCYVTVAWNNRLGKYFKECVLENSSSLNRPKCKFFLPFLLLFTFFTFDKFTKKITRKFHHVKPKKDILYCF